MRARMYDYDRIAEMYQAGHTYAEIADETGCRPEQIPQILSDAGIEKRGCGGELSHKNKLTEKDVLKIYRLRFEQEETVGAIAARFDIRPTTVSTICLGQTWKGAYEKYMSRQKEKGR